MLPAQRFVPAQCSTIAMVLPRFPLPLPRPDQPLLRQPRVPLPPPLPPPRLVVVVLPPPRLVVVVVVVVVVPVRLSQTRHP